MGLGFWGLGLRGLGFRGFVRVVQDEGFELITNPPQLVLVFIGLIIDRVSERG